MHHLQVENLLSDKQFGFINGRSTTLQLLNYLDKCADIIARGVVDTIYLDFAKAFDAVPQFLTGRTQVVLVNGTHSLPADVVSGIPQGTVLGPLLFIIYINDILTNVECDGYLFADDTKIFREISTLNDSITLQKDIHSLESWTKRWLLGQSGQISYFNARKICKYYPHTSLYSGRLRNRACLRRKRPWCDI